MTALTLSILALILGPVVAVAGNRFPRLLPLLDGFVVVSICGLVLLEVIPYALKEVGLSALLLAGAGLIVPSMFEKYRGEVARKAHVLALSLAILGILGHSLIDGISLAVAGSGAEESALTWAIVIHRLPAGLAIWWLLRPIYGKRVAVAVLTLAVLVTFVGWLAGTGGESWLEGFPTGALMALMGGALLHVMLHGSEPKIAKGSNGPALSAFGGLLGLGFVLFTILDPGHAQAHSDHYEPLSRFFDNFLYLARESAPALLIAYTVAGLIHACLPRATVDWLARGSTTRQAMKGLVFGIPLPICSCGILPLYKSLVNKGVPTAAAVTLLLATPELGIDAIFLSFQLVDTPFAIARIITAAVLALTVGLLAVRFIPPISPEDIETVEESDQKSLPERLRQGLRVGLGDLVDNTAPWIVFGLALAAALKPLVEDGEFFASIPGALEVPAFALLGLPIYVCASGATPLAAVLIFGGASPGAAIAFLLTGPATNVTTFGILGSMHGKKAAILFAVAVGIGAIGCGYAVNAFIPEVTANVANIATGHDHEAGTGSANQIASFANLLLMAVGLLFAASIFRKGPRSFMSQVFGVPTDDPDGADDASCCSTDEEPTEPEPGKT